MNKHEMVRFFVKSDGFIDIANDKIKEYLHDIRWRKRIINKFKTVPTKEGSVLRASLDDMISELECDLKSLNENLKKMEVYKDIASGKVKKSFDIDIIRGIAISSLLNTKPIKKYQQKEVYLCPLHNEKTGSFHYNADKNLFYCFGCNEGGDVIAFYMKLHNLKFVDACRELNNLI